MKKYSLKVSLYRIFAISVLMPFLIICLCLPFFYHQQILKSYQTNNQIILQTLISHLDSSLQNSERFFMQYLFDTNISRFYHYVDTYEIDASQENLYQYIRYSAKYRNSLNNYLTIADPTVKGIGFLPEKANRNTLFYLEKYTESIVRSDRDEQWSINFRKKLEDTSKGNTIILPGSIREDSGEEQVFTMICPIKYLETGVQQGYVFQEISLDVFKDLEKAITFPEGAGLVIYYSDGSAAYFTDKKFVRTLDTEPDKFGKYIRVEKEAHYQYQMCDEKYGFWIDYLLPEKIILSEAQRTALGILLVWLGTMVFAFLLFVNLSRKISDSTEKMISYICQYRLGDSSGTSAEMPQMSIEEFEDISKALTEMTERITSLVQHEYIWKMNQQMAEYKAMQAEINPHFFHNVMNSLQALNRIGDTRNLEKGIVNLSRMFRYTCEPGYDSTIKRECRFIESYLMLEKIRFESRLQYSIWVEPWLEEFSIPKLLLQPLIENAMCHGMPVDGSPLNILLQVCQVKGGDGQQFVWIMIANDGTPYHQEDVSVGSRVGITSVRERLSITYPRSFFWYDRKGRFQTVCNMLIPEENILPERGKAHEDTDCR